MWRCERCPEGCRTVQKGVKLSHLGRKWPGLGLFYLRVEDSLLARVPEVYSTFINFIDRKGSSRRREGLFGTRITKE